MLDRFILFFVSLSILGFFVGMLINPKNIYFFGLVLLIMFFSLAKFYSWKIKDKKFWYFLITPLLFFVSSILFFGFLEGQFFLKCVIIILFASLQWLIYQNIFFLFKLPQKYQSNSIRNIFDFINLISIFFLVSSFFALIIFVHISVWLLSIVLFLISSLYFFQFFWLNRVLEKRAWFFAFIFALIFVEIFYVITFLPISFYIGGLILTLVYFNIKSIGKKYFLNIFYSENRQCSIAIIKKNTIQYLIINILILTLLLATAQYY